MPRRLARRIAFAALALPSVLLAGCRREPATTRVASVTGAEASARLMGAWQTMEGRYTAWGEATKDSIYRHLCALDLF